MTPRVHKYIPRKHPTHYSTELGKVHEDLDTIKIIILKHISDFTLCTLV